MKHTSSYSIAGFNFCVTDENSVMSGLKSFEPFEIKNKEISSTILFNATIEYITSYVPNLLGVIPLEEADNGFGNIRMYRLNDFYLFEVRCGNKGFLHTMQVNKEFSNSSISLNNRDPFKETALSSMLHILFSMAVLPKGGITFHASCVELDHNGYMFLGKSGTGKSTHSSLWIKNFPSCKLLNDDNPVVRIADGDINVAGTPWSGKTSCYRNKSVPLKGIARLEQSKFNEFVPLKDTDAFIALLPSCSVIRSDSYLIDSLYNSLIKICEKTCVGILKCRPDTEATLICRDNLIERNF